MWNYFYVIIGEELLVPTKIYTSAVKTLLREGSVKAIAHITGKSTCITIFLSH